MNTIKHAMSIALLLATTASCAHHPPPVAGDPVPTAQGASLADCLRSLQAKGLDQVTTLDCSKRGIRSAEGLERLPHLRELNLGANALTALDLSGLTELEVLDLTGNEGSDVRITFPPQKVVVSVVFRRALREDPGRQGAQSRHEGE